MEECEYLQLSSTNCKHCYKCIGHCPVKAISFSSGSDGSGEVQIMPSECILCGECFVNCPQHAKSIKNDVLSAKELIESGADVYASIAPSFAANYPGAGVASMRDALKKLGFKGAFETAVGATHVKRGFEELVKPENQNVVITSCCHSINLLIQKYFPKQLACLAPVDSPMQVHSKIIKAHSPGARTVFIGPCISKKAEADLYQDTDSSVDYVLTFGELDEWLFSEGIEIKHAAQDDAGGRARFFPTAGGILRSMTEFAPEWSYVAVDGVRRCIETLKDIEAGNLKQCFIEMSACIGSCAGGPAMSLKNRSEVRDRTAVERYALSAHGVDFETGDMPVETGKQFTPEPVRRIFPGKAALDEALRSMGKNTPEDELNCGYCGYETCRDKAVAVIVGKAEKNMCLPYLMKRAQSFSDNIIDNSPNGIIVLDESLAIQQINGAARNILNIRDESDVLGMDASCLLDPVPLMQVVSGGGNIYEKRVLMIDYKRCVMQSVVFDRENAILIVIMRDVTDEEAARERKIDICRSTMEITDGVVEKQLRSVQEIASLLGETAAETQVALGKLKEALSNEQFLR